MSLSTKIFFSLRKKKKTGFPASSFGSSGARSDAKLITETLKFTKTKQDCSSNMRIHKRKLHEVQKNNTMKKQKGKEISVVIDELSIFKAIADLLPGGSSKSWFCRICMDQKPSSMMFKETRSDHYFCFDCVRRYIATKLKDKNMILVHCPEPNCKSLITPQQCKSILPGEVIYRWENALLYSLMSPILVFECPFEDCKANLVYDGEDVGGMQYECPKCLTKICGECRDFEHEGMGCEEFKELVNCWIEEEEFDLALLKLAEDEK